MGDMLARPQGASDDDEADAVDPLVRLPCGGSGAAPHAFHARCFARWLEWTHQQVAERWLVAPAISHDLP